MEESFSSKKLFVRQSSGLVRDVSMTNALFFNIAAFVGTAIGWAITFYSLGTEWKAWGISAFAWMAVLTGLACYFLALIFASLTTAMPRSGGDYVFTSRIISPFWGWLESWTLTGSALTIIGFEIIVAIRNIQMAGVMLGLAFPGSFFSGAQGWLQDSLSKIITGLVVMLIIAGISILRTRTFHKLVTVLSLFALVTVIISFFGAFSVDPVSMNAALPKLGTSAKVITDAATKAGWSIGSPDFSFTGLIGLAALISVVLLNFIGFQYSSYIAGEVKGNVRRSVVFALTGALLLAVFMNSVYMDVLGSRFGFELSNAWGYLYWLGDPKTPLGGLPPFTPLMSTAVHPELWWLWVIVALGNFTLNVLVCPVYAIFLSRIVLAWALDRQVPEWFSKIDERTHAPLRVILLAVALGAVFYIGTFFGLNLATTAFFGILLGGLTWILPGFNAILIPYRRPDLFKLTNNTGTFLGLPRLVWYGILWLLFIVPVYLASFIWPVIQNILTNGGGNGFLLFANSSGVSAAIGLVVIGIIIYFIMKWVNRHQGIDTRMMFHELPPD